jgi:hypothetical protein
MTLQMKAGIKDRWLEALRSGGYRQGQSSLHLTPDDGEDMFCCLGVLCDIAFTDDVIGRERMDSDLGSDCYMYGSASAYLPTAVINWAGIYWDDERGGLDSSQYEAAGRYMPSSEATLAKANDRGDSFEEIADIIEKYVEAV